MEKSPRAVNKLDTFILRGAEDKIIYYFATFFFFNNLKIDV